MRRTAVYAPQTAKHCIASISAGGLIATYPESYASLLIRATDQRRSKKLFGLRSTSARFQRKCFFPLSANLRKILYEREIELKNRFDALFSPIMGKFYDTTAP